MLYAWSRLHAHLQDALKSTLLCQTHEACSKRSVTEPACFLWLLWLCCHPRRQPLPGRTPDRQFQMSWPCFAGALSACDMRKVACCLLSNSPMPYTYSLIRCASLEADAGWDDANDGSVHETWHVKASPAGWHRCSTACHSFTCSHAEVVCTCMQVVLE
jgi:hypothetical protein